jgi:hypothetical protein
MLVTVTMIMLQRLLTAIKEVCLNVTADKTKYMFSQECKTQL